MGVVLNITSHGEIWNQPVFAMDRCETTLEPGSLSPNTAPIGLFEARDLSLNTWLKSFGEQDQEVASRFSFMGESEYNWKTKQLKDSLSELDTALQNQHNAQEIKALVKETVRSVQQSADYQGGSEPHVPVGGRHLAE